MLNTVCQRLMQADHGTESADCRTPTLSSCPVRKRAPPLADVQPEVLERTGGRRSVCVTSDTTAGVPLERAVTLIIAAPVAASRSSLWPTASSAGGAGRSASSAPASERASAGRQGGLRAGETR